MILACSRAATLTPSATSTHFSTIVPATMIRRIDVTATRVSKTAVAMIYSIGPNTDDARLVKAKNEKNSPLRDCGVIWANRLLASAWLPPITSPTRAPSTNHWKPALKPSGFHRIERTKTGHQSTGPVPRTDG